MMQFLVLLVAQDAVPRLGFCARIRHHLGDCKHQSEACFWGFGSVFGDQKHQNNPLAGERLRPLGHVSADPYRASKPLVQLSFFNKIPHTGHAP